MPDLITHITLGHLFIRGWELIRKTSDSAAFRVVFYAGTLLPDLMTRPWYILFPGTYRWTVAMHTPAGALICCGLVCLLFDPLIRKRILTYLAAGSIDHFILDALQKQVLYNNYWFFPLSWRPVGWGIAGAGTYLEWIPVWIGLVLLFECMVFLFRKRHAAIR